MPLKDGTFAHNPSIRVEPITNMGEACDNFVQARMGDVGVSGDSAPALLPANQGQKRPIPDGKNSRPGFWGGGLHIFLNSVGVRNLETVPEEEKEGER
jgi:hypothetical protein